MLSIIVAKAKNNVIGKNNDLIWHLPEDLKYFKRLTMGHNIIMGRKTFDSLGRVLPKRKHIIFTKNTDFYIDNEQVEIVHSIEEIQNYIEDDEENFVIGGAQIYKMLIPYTNKMYITEIKEEFEGDAIFPDIDYESWEKVSSEKGIRDENNDLDYEFVVYKKIK